MKRRIHRFLPSINVLVWLCVLLLAYARWVEPNMIRVEEVPLPREARGKSPGDLRIVHLADLHISREGSRERRLVEKVNALSPDLVLVTGDMAQFYSGTAAARRVLSRFHARLGTFVVLGDADYSNREDHCLYCHREDGRSLLSDPSFRVLRNSALSVRTPAGEWVIGGVDDEEGPCAGRFPSLSPEGKAAEFRILLAPSPLVLPEAAEREYDLVFTGDTHGGQVRIPGIGPVYGWLDSARFGFEGWVGKNETWMFINRGIGTSYLPFRFNCPPLVACFDATSRSTGQ